MMFKHGRTLQLMTEDGLPARNSVPMHETQDQIQALGIIAEKLCCHFLLWPVSPHVDGPVLCYSCFCFVFPRVRLLSSCLCAYSISLVFPVLFCFFVYFTRDMSFLSDEPIAPSSQNRLNQKITLLNSGDWPIKIRNYLLYLRYLMHLLYLIGLKSDTPMMQRLFT